MKVSLNIVKQFIDFELPPTSELVDKINRQLGSVEQTIDLKTKYKDARIVVVARAEKHPNADRLSVCFVDDGGVSQNIPRDEDGLIQVVCGAPNVHGGMLAVWLPPKATVPASFDDDEPFVLDARELRGVLSQGMLAAADELAIGSDHEGIIEITDYDMPVGVEKSDAIIGKSFSEVFGLDDTIIDIENKMFTHRPDLFGQLGVAREIYAILGGVTPASEGTLDVHFKNPELYQHLPSFEEAHELELEVFNDVVDKVPRVMFVAMSGVEVKPSPLWLQCALVAMGSKPINNIVDATNYIMLTTAQPTHAYDYDKIRGHKIGARMARDGEKITLLNDKEYQLTADDIVIADGERAISLGGIMGGSETEVDENTKNIVLEVATFDMYAVRKSSMRHGVFTDALTRFNKGQSPIQNSRVLAMLMKSIKDVTDASQASNVYDVPLDKWTHVESVHGEIRVSRDFVNQRLGLDLTAAQIGNLLRRADIVSWPDDNDSDTLVVTAPFWRTDIEIAEDLVEEVGRLYDFGELPRELPRRSIKPAPENLLRQTKQTIRESLSSAGANEVLNYSFVHGKLLDHVGQNSEHAFKLSNALSPDLQYYRLSLMPSLLAKVHTNIKAGHDEFALFEIGKSHIVGQNNEENLPREDELTALVYTTKDTIKKSGAAYYSARRYLQHLVGKDLTYKPVSDAMREYDITKPYDMTRTAFMYSGDTFLGIVGEFNATVRANLKLPKYTAGFELDTAALVDILGKNQYTPLSRYPSVTQDITLRVSGDLAYQDIYDVVWRTINESQPDDTSSTLEPLGIYQSDDDQEHKNITLRLTTTSYDRTLRAEEITSLLDRVVEVSHDKFGAERL